MNEIEKLQQEIEEKIKLINKLKRSSKKEVIKDLSEYTDEEKIKFFDDTYNSSLELLIQKENGEIGDEIDTQYDWEANMLLLAKDQISFWKYWNSLPDMFSLRQ
jgi:hypothetical protein